MGSRKKLLLGNWKMHKLRKDVPAFMESLLANIGDKNSWSQKLNFGFGVPATLFDVALSTTKNTGVKILAQNCHFEEQGAFTGELSCAMLQECGLHGSIIGHSERRQYYAETNTYVGKKWNSLALKGLLPVICVGESKIEREQNKTFDVVRQQIDDALLQVSEDARKCEFVIAYEPVWAIGTGLTATPEMAQDVHKFIRNELSKHFGATRSGTISILYGGSMNAANAKELLAMPDIDGGLIGGASLKPDEFAKIIKAAL
ncbi:MAG: triose-phosphate isomerase [Proteobacteria bacterium]|nr:triose-phosphate isomerase [Pseudomonadota bacterium]